MGGDQKKRTELFSGGQAPCSTGLLPSVGGYPRNPAGGVVRGCVQLQ